MNSTIVSLVAVTLMTNFAWGQDSANDFQYITPNVSSRVSHITGREADTGAQPAKSDLVAIHSENADRSSTRLLLANYLEPASSGDADQVERFRVVNRGAGLPPAQQPSNQVRVAQRLPHHQAPTSGAMSTYAEPHSDLSWESFDPYDCDTAALRRKHFFGVDRMSCCDEWRGFCNCGGLKTKPGHWGISWLRGDDPCECDSCGNSTSHCPSCRQSETQHR